MYDEAKGKADIKALSQDGRCHLSHLLRNGLCNILSAHCLKLDVESEIQALENRIEELGL